MLVCFLFVTTACEKDSEIYDTPTKEKPIPRFSKTASEISSEFFNPYFAANQNSYVNPTTASDEQMVNDSLLQEVIQELSTENNSNEFVVKTTKLIGYPIWNKSKAYKDFANMPNVSTIMTPFTFLEDNIVSAVLVSTKIDNNFSYKIYNWEVDYFLTLDSAITKLNFSTSYVDYVSGRKALYDVFDAVVFNPLKNDYDIVSSITVEDITNFEDFMIGANEGVLFNTDAMEDMGDGGGGGGGSPCDWGIWPWNWGDNCPDAKGGRMPRGRRPNTGGGSSGGSSGGNSGGTFNINNFIPIVVYHPFNGEPSGTNGGGSAPGSNSGGEISFEDFYNWDGFSEYFNGTITDMEVTIALNEMGGFFANIETDCESLSENAFEVALYMLLDALQGELPDVDIPSMEEIGDISMAQSAFESGNWIPTATLVLVALDNEVTSDELSSVIAGLGNVTEGVAESFESLGIVCQEELYSNPEIYENFIELVSESLEETDCEEAFLTNLNTVFNLLNDNPMALLEACAEEGVYVDDWINLAIFNPNDVTEVVDKLEILGDGYEVQTLYNATGTPNVSVNMDFFGINITEFPYHPNGTQMTSDEFLEYIRQHWVSEDFFGTNGSCYTSVLNPLSGAGSFSYYEDSEETEENTWLSNNPLGTTFTINMFDDGTVMATDYNFGCCWTFSTLGTAFFGDSSGNGAWDGYHPVSGNRRFGLRDNGDGTFTFYTQGVDRMTMWWHALTHGSGIVDAYETAGELWTCVLDQIKEFVENNGGQIDVNYEMEFVRPKWADLYDYLLETCNEIPENVFEFPCTDQ